MATYKKKGLKRKSSNIDTNQSTTKVRHDVGGRLSSGLHLALGSSEVSFPGNLFDAKFLEAGRLNDADR